MVAWFSVFHFGLTHHHQVASVVGGGTIGHKSLFTAFHVITKELAVESPTGKESKELLFLFALSY